MKFKSTLNVKLGTVTLMGILALGGCANGNDIAALSPTARPTPLALTGVTQFGVAGNYSDGNSVTVDLSGNFYIAGDTSANLAAGVGTSVGTQDLFVAKYNSTGVKQWIKQLGGSVRYTYGTAVGTDSSGNVYVAGTTHANLETGATNSAGNGDYFVAKLSSEGTLLWLKQAGITSMTTTTGLHGMSVHPSGKVTLVGSSDGNLVTGSGASTGTSDCFLAQYETSGARLWIKQFGVASEDCTSSAVTIDSSENILVTGYTSGNVVSGTGGATGSSDFYIAKYNSSGVRQWIRQEGVTGKTTLAFGAAFDTSGNAYITGYTEGNLMTGSGNATGLEDLFVARYDASGTKTWIKQRGVAGYWANAYSIAVDAGNNVYVGGQTTANIVTGSGPTTGATDAFVTKYDSSGAVLWTKIVGVPTFGTRSLSIALDSSANVLLVGATEANLKTGSGSATGSTDFYALVHSTDGVRQ